MSAVSCLDWGNRPLARSTAVPKQSDDLVAQEAQIDDALHAMRLLVRATSPSASESDHSEDEEHSPAEKGSWITLIGSLRGQQQHHRCHYGRARRPQAIKRNF